MKPGGNTFDLLHQEISLRKIPYLLIGGFALHFYGVTRQTLDVDFLVEEKYFEEIRKILEGREYACVYKDTLFSRFRSGETGFLDLDFLFVDAGTFKALFHESKEIEIASHGFRVPGLSHLIALKAHAISQNKSRESKDLLDLLGLLKQNELTPESCEVKDAFKKYGVEDSWGKLKILWT